MAAGAVRRERVKDEPRPRAARIAPEEPEATGKIAKNLAPLIGMLYALPAYSGFGQHWLIEKPEADMLAKHLEECIKQLPKGAAKQLMMIVGTYAPWLGLAFTAYNITAPRVRETIRIKRVQNLSRQRPGEPATVEGFTPAPSDAPNGGQPPGGNASGRTGARISELFE